MTDMLNPEEKNIAQTIIDNIPVARILETTNGVLCAVPKGTEIKNLTEEVLAAKALFKPLRRTGTAQLTTLESLICWANRFKDENSTLYVNTDPEASSITCISNYHKRVKEPQKVDDGDRSARYGDHRGVYKFPLSKAWLKWTEISGKPLNKDQMGEFIEDQIKDIFDPTPQILEMKPNKNTTDWENDIINIAQKLQGRFATANKLMAMSREFIINETSNLIMKSNRDTGELNVSFETKHDGEHSSALKIPNLFLVAISVFESGEFYRLVVRLRYRKLAGDVKFFLSIYNPETAISSAINIAVETTVEQTKLPVFMGTPECV